MAIIVDPDNLTRFSTIFNTDSETISSYPVATQRFATGGPHTIHDAWVDSTGSIRRDEVAAYSFDGTSGVDDTADIITLPLHSLQTGDRLIYDQNGMGGPLTPLADNDVVFVRRVDENDIKIYTTSAAAYADGTQINLVDTAGAAHQLEFFKDWNTDGAVAVGDVVCILTGIEAGHYYVQAEVTDTLTLADIDDGTAGAPTTGLDNTGGNFPFDGITAVNTGTDVITIGAHTYNTGDSVVYFDLDLADEPAPLISGSRYYVIRSSGTEIQLAFTLADALAGTQIDITATGTTGDHEINTALTVAVFTNGANTAETLGGLSTAGDGTGIIRDGATLQTYYSYGKEEWRLDSIQFDELLGNWDADDYSDDLIRHEFPFEAITSEQFEVGGGTSHTNWSWFNAYSEKKVRTGGWAEKNTATTTLLEFTGIVTLGSLDSDTQVYYQNVDAAAPINFTFLGVVNEPIQTFQDGGDNNRTFLKLFARKKARSYAGSEIGDIGVTTIQTIVNRFPLAHAVDTAIVARDAAILGTTPFRDAHEIGVGSTAIIDGTDGDTQAIGGTEFLSPGSLFNNETVFSASIVGAGTGYASGEVLSVVEGTSTVPATFTIVTVSGSSIATITPLERGAYTVANANPVTTTVAPTGGTGATLNINWESPGAGDMLTITNGTENNFTYTIASVTSDTELELATDADFSGFATDEPVVTFDIRSAVVTADNSSDIVASWTTTGTGDGIIESGTPGVGSIVDPADGFQSYFSGVTVGDILEITSSVSSTRNGVYKVLDSTTTGASNPTSFEIFVDTSDQAFPGSLEADIEYVVRSSGMFLQNKEIAISNAAPTDYDFNPTGGAGGGPSITRSDGTWDAAVVVGSMIEVTLAEDTANNGRYTVLLVDSTTEVSLLNTSTNPDVITLNTEDTVAVLTFTEGFQRTIGSDAGGSIFAFRWRLFGNDSTLANNFQFVQHQLRLTSDIDPSSNSNRGDITDLLMSFASPTGTGLDMIIDDLDSNDINNATFNDHSGSARNFPFTAAGNLNFNANLVSDAGPAKYWLFFLDDNAPGDNLGRDYGTTEAIIVEDATDPTPLTIEGNITGSTIAFTYAYDTNVQRGSGSGASDAPVVLVAIGLITAQFVIANATITRAVGQTITAVAALERNYSNP